MLETATYVQYSAVPVFRIAAVYRNEALYSIVVRFEISKVYVQHSVMPKWSHCIKLLSRGTDKLTAEHKHKNVSERIPLPATN